MGTKVAKLVTISLTTRVIVDVNATNRQVVAAAENGFRAKIDNNEAYENIISIRKDNEMPYSQDDE